MPATQLMGFETKGPPSGVVTELESKEKPTASAGSAEKPAATAGEPPTGLGVIWKRSDPAAEPR